MSAVFDESGEAFERSLFERRARVARAGAGAPSLEAVLRAARIESRETSIGRSRAWGGLVLAAACLLAVMKARPRDGSPAEITADVDRRAFTAAEVGGVCQEQAISSSAVDSTCASMTTALPVVPDSRTCDAPLATFDPSATLSCDGDEINRSYTH